MRYRSSIIQLVCAWVIFLVGGCSSTDLDKDGNPKVFKIALSTSNEDNPQEATRNMEPMRLYLEAKLHVPVRYIQVVGYAPVIEALRARKIQMAQMSPYPYLLARDKAQVTALFCMGKKDGSQTGDYKSCIITRKSSGLKTLDDIKANISKLTLSFVDPASSSGHIIPYNYLIRNGIDPEREFKKVVFTSSHPASILTLISGKVDVACAEKPVIVQMHNRFKSVSVDSFNFIWVSPPIPATAYCLRNDINPQFRKKVLEAYMSVKEDTAAWNAIKRNRLTRMSTTLPLDSLSYIPVDLKIYDEFSKMVKGMKDVEIK